MSSEDNLSQLQELVNKGEKRGVFNDSMPSIIQRSVRREGGREGGRKGREGGGRKGGREGREGGRKGGREGGRKRGEGGKEIFSNTVYY